MSDEQKETTSSEEEQAPVTTHHRMEVGGKILRYKATIGMMPLKDKQGETKANIFYTAYTSGNPAERPLTFVFNGGPGSSSVWLHLGAIGPKRVVMHQEDGWMPPPPYQLVDNEHTWLTDTDLVFIDPVGTGYSRAVNPDDNKDYWSVEGDLESVGEFIRLYLSRSQRWASPLFLAGESYGTTRAAGLAGHLIDKGIALNGIALISTILTFQTAYFMHGNDVPFHLYLPSYAATAWYHNQLADHLQEKSLPDLVAEVTEWAETDYLLALAKGSRLSDDEREAITAKLAEYTGLSEEFIGGTDIRIQLNHFRKELMRGDKRHVGRLDSRFTGFDKIAVTGMPEFDPSMSAIMPPYTAMFNQYIRAELGYETDRIYEILSYEVNRKWDWKGFGYPDTSDKLRQAFNKNPYMHVLVAQGYYDLATPFFAATYTMEHLGIDPDLYDQIETTYYEAGHMFYLHLPSLAKLKQDALALMERSTG